VRALGQQIVAAASFNGPPNELANRRALGQNDSCIDIRSIGFAPGNVRLIDEQFQFIANFLASQIISNGLLHRHRRSITRVLYLCGDLPPHTGRARTLFLRIFENPKTFESATADEIQ